MNATEDRLQTLRVSDVMSRHLVTIPIHATMADAAKAMCANNVRGLPVVNEMGHCVGVLTTTDFARQGQKFGGTGGCDALGDEFVLVRNDVLAPVHVDHIAADRVETHMSTAVQSIDEHAPLVSAARYMCGEHIHRLIVLDTDSRPVGVISSLDLVSAIVGMVDE